MEKHYFMYLKDLATKKEEKISIELRWVCQLLFVADALHNKKELWLKVLRNLRNKNKLFWE